MDILLNCICVGGAVIFDRMNRQLAVIIIFCVKAFGMFITPHCPTLTTFFLSVGMVGTASGAYDTAQFVWMVEMMQKDCPPFVQGQHFFYALGTIAGTLVMAPFLTDDDSIPPSEKAARLIVPFSIIGSMAAANVVFQLMLFARFRYFKPPPEVNHEERERLDDITQMDRNPSEGPIFCGFQLWSWPKLRLVILSCAFYGAYCGMELITFQFLPKFGQNSDLKLSEQYSAYVLTGMTVAFATGRGSAIFLVFKISPKILLCFNITLIIVANVILLVWANSSLYFFWTASIIFGFGFSSSYASFAASIERHLNITNFIGSMILVSAYGLPVIYPLIVGSFIETNPVVLCYVTFFSLSIIIGAVSSLLYLTFYNKTKYS